jgi:predicted nucleotidyltransferase
MVEVIVQEVDPERVYVFGSYARGTARDDSDLDLLIVEREPFSPERSRRLEMARLSRLLARFRVPKDVLVYSSDEVAHWQAAKNHVVAHALREGRLVYERH